MAATPDTYHVFRRHSDGYVGAIAGDIRRLTEPNGRIGGVDTSFEVLLSTQDWPQARDLIAHERATPQSASDMQRAHDIAHEGA